jgi:hypothetical protein
MKCLHCGAELIYHDYYGYLCAHQSGEKLGNIYKCPNHEGFEDMDEAIQYAINNNIIYVDWEEIACESNCFNGFYYTDKNENLHEGYPC